MSDARMSDAQYVLLYLLMWSGQRGRAVIRRSELRNSVAMSRDMATRLQMAALLMPGNLLSWSEGQEAFSITTAGKLALMDRYGMGAPIDELRSLMVETGMAAG
jgi:hypothetical protein